MNMLLLETMKCGGKVEYSVTLITGTTDEDVDFYVEGVDKTRIFETEAEALRCFEQLRPIAKLDPYTALKRFNRYGKSSPTKLPLSKCVGKSKRIRHCVKRPDGTKSYWQAVLAGEEIAYPGDNTLKWFGSLNAFVSAHYTDEHPTRKSGKAWEECETLIFGEWVKMSVVREVVA
jgi:hypothetical protein